MEIFVQIQNGYRYNCTQGTLTLWMVEISNFDFLLVVFSFPIQDENDSVLWLFWTFPNNEYGYISIKFRVGNLWLSHIAIFTQFHMNAKVIIEIFLDQTVKNKREKEFHMEKHRRFFIHKINIISMKLLWFWSRFIWWKFLLTLFYTSHRSKYYLGIWIYTSFSAVAGAQSPRIYTRHFPVINPTKLQISSGIVSRDIREYSKCGSSYLKSELRYELRGFVFISRL